LFLVRLADKIIIGRIDKGKSTTFIGLRIVATFLTDEQIFSLISERKSLPQDFRAKLSLKDKPGQKEREFDLLGEDGNRFRIILRQSRINPLNFSAILGYLPPGVNRPFRLTRYNGKHRHTNRMEKQTFDGFHIHLATERYQEVGLDEEAYAEITDRYGDFNAAFQCMLDECGFEIARGPQKPLFEGQGI